MLPESHSADVYGNGMQPTSWLISQPASRCPRTVRISTEMMAALFFLVGDSEESEDLGEEEGFELDPFLGIGFLPSFFPDLVRSHP